MNDWSALQVTSLCKLDDTRPSTNHCHRPTLFVLASANCTRFGGVLLPLPTTPLTGDFLFFARYSPRFTHDLLLPLVMFDDYPRLLAEKHHAFHVAISRELIE